MNRNKLRTIVATGAAAAVLGIAGLAFAAFTQQTASSAMDMEAETFEPVVVNGVAGDATLWPGQKTNVTLTVDNASNDVAITVTRVDAVPLTDNDIKGVVNADRAYCRSQLVLTGAPSISEVIAGNSSGPVVLTNGIELLATADNRCQGMKFSTKWTVSAQTNAAS